jgi:hypothetical protein
VEAVEDESDEDDEEADAMLVMNDEGVELEAAAPEIPSDDESVEVDVAPVKPRSVSSDLVALRQNARKASTKAQGNKFERQKRHEESSADRAFMDACNAVKSSYRDSEFNPRAFYKDVKSLKKLKKEGIYSESQYQAKLLILKNRHEAGLGNKVKQQATKKTTSAAKSVSASAEEDSQDEEAGNASEMEAGFGE